jgi:hypothetical protein
LGQQEPGSSPPVAWWRRLETWQQLVSILAGLAGVVGLLLALGVIEASEDPDPPANPPASEDGEIPRFDGVAGNFEQSRALLGFFDQNDAETVYLDVGFPDHLTGPAGGDNVAVETVPVEGGGHKASITDLTLITECSSDASLEENPTVADGCMGTSLQIDGPETDDSTTFFEHGVPVIQGHFEVDVTGALHMGITPILLRPLGLEEATGA